MRERAAAAILLLSLASSARAVAAEPPASPEQDVAFREGLDQYARGNKAGAVATWENLLTTLGEERGYKVLYNLGLAYQATGDVTHAIERYRAFVTQVARREDVSRELTDRAADARRRLEQLEQSHGAVRVRAPTRGGLVLTRVGTSEPRAAGYVVWLAPGPHVVELFVGTDHGRRMTIDVEAGARIEIDTTPPEPPAAPPPSRPVPPSESASPPRPEVARSSTWIWLGAGATVVSFALPATLFALASSERDSATALGRGHSGYEDARASYEALRVAHYASYALPLSLAVATVAYVALRPSAAEPKRAGRAAPGSRPAGSS